LAIRLSAKLSNNGLALPANEEGGQFIISTLIKIADQHNVVLPTAASDGKGLPNQMSGRSRIDSPHRTP
jgi:hypothetical protein